MRTDRHRLDQLQNLLIVLLTCSALLLLFRSGLLPSAGWDPAQTGPGAAGSAESASFSRNVPVTLALQTSQGRWGFQCQQDTVAALYDGGLRELLTQAISTMTSVRTASREEWQEAITQGEDWVFYDFLYNTAFSGQSEGTARFFLLTLRSGRAETLYYYNQASRSYYSAQVQGTVDLETLLAGYSPDGSTFAFQLEGLDLPEYQLVRQTAPVCLVYTASNPLTAMDAAAREAMLERLSFNTRAASPYQTADGTVIREGADTLRLQKNGKLIFQGSESGEARYQAASPRDRDLQRKAEEILDQVASGQGQLYCQGITSLGDGAAELTFYYLLGGARVNLWETDYSAKFYFQGSTLLSYEIFLRDYQATEERCAIPPLRQAAAAASAAGQGGKELQLCYRDDGGDQVRAGWAVRVQE